MRFGYKKIVFFLRCIVLLWFLGFIVFANYIYFATNLNNNNSVNTSDNIYKDYVTLMFNKDNSNFVPYKEYDTNKNIDVRLIALYLPQFHQFKENNEWHGKGFTEWSNVTKAKPLFRGHYQPKLPIDVGFYDLTHDDVMYRQIELAKNYGIGGFAFYYYWFSGKKLMEKPVYNYLNNKELDFPFCIHWANENWSKRWDGGNQELLMEQKFSSDDFEKFAKDLLEFFKDTRYIKINGRPLFIVYRPALFDRKLFVDFTNYLREYAKNHGVEAPYIIATKQFNLTDNPKDWGLDAVMEFEIDNIQRLEQKNVQKIDTSSKFRIFDWEKYINSGREKRDYKYKTFKTVFPRWDNSSRKAYTGALIFDGTTPDVYGKWLQYAIDTTKKMTDKDEHIVFINAWNEWAEGAMLEPDEKYGYAYLDVTRKVIDNNFIPENNNSVASGVAVLKNDNIYTSKAIELLNQGKGDYLFITGLNPGSSFNLFSSREDVVLDSVVNIDLKYKTKKLSDKVSEIKEWIKKHNIGKIYIVTEACYIPRLRRGLKDFDIHFITISSDENQLSCWNNFKSIFSEYNMYLLSFLSW